MLRTRGIASFVYQDLPASENVCPLPFPGINMVKKRHGGIC